MSKAHRVQTLKVNLLDTGENLLGELPGVEGADSSTTPTPS